LKLNVSYEPNIDTNIFGQQRMLLLFGVQTRDYKWIY